MKTTLRMAMIGLIVLAIAQTVSASIIYETDKLIYQQGEPVKFTIENYNPYPIYVDIRWPTIYNLEEKCIYGCSPHILNYVPITISTWGNYSWVWNQTDDNGTQVDIGYYESKFADAGISVDWSNMFVIEEFTVNGYIRNGVEGGCIILKGDNGYNYLLKHEGVVPPAGSYVKVTGKIRNDMVSYCMEGDKILEVKSIYRIK